MLIKHQMDVGGLGDVNNVDPLEARQMFGRHQYLAFVKMQRGFVVGHQNTVVGGYQHVTFRHPIAQRPLGNQHRFQVFGALQRAIRDVAGPDPADVLNAIVAGDNTVADLQVLDKAFPGWRGDPGAGGKAGRGCHGAVTLLGIARCIAEIIRELPDAGIVLRGYKNIRHLKTLRWCHPRWSILRQTREISYTIFHAVSCPRSAFYGGNS